MSKKDLKPEISFFLSYSSIFHLGAWRNSIELWAKKGYKITLYQFKDPNNTNLKSDLEKRYKLVEIPYPFILRGILYLVKRIYRSLNFLGIKTLTNFGDGFSYIIEAFFYIVGSLVLYKEKTKQLLICGDSPGLITAYLLKKKTSLLVFWSLELKLMKEISNFGFRLFKLMEKICNKKAICTIEFGEIRCRLLREENNLHNQKMFSIPNSAIGPAIMKRDYYFNHMFNIPNEKKIILYSGGVHSEVYRIKDLWIFLKSLKHYCVLVIHARQKSNITNKTIFPPNLTINKDFYFDDNPVPYYQIDKIYSSGDIGLVLNGPPDNIMDSNQLYSDLSLGKLFQYLKNGVPLVTRNLPGFKELIEGNGVGLCFENPSDIPQCINKILANEKTYKKNCLVLYEKMRFEKYHEEFVKFIETKFKIPMNGS